MVNPANAHNVFLHDDADLRRAAGEHENVLRLNPTADDGWTITNLTRESCQILINRSITRGRIVELDIAGHRAVEARVVAFGRDGYECQFMELLPAGAVTAAVHNNARLSKTNHAERHRASIAPLALSGVVSPHDVKFSPRGRVVLLVSMAAVCWGGIAVIAAIVLG